MAFTVYENTYMGPSLYNLAKVGKLHLDCSTGKLLPTANYGSVIYRMQEVQRKKISVHCSRTFMMS